MSQSTETLLCSLFTFVFGYIHGYLCVSLDKYILCQLQVKLKCVVLIVDVLFHAAEIHCCAVTVRCAEQSSCVTA